MNGDIIGVEIELMALFSCRNHLDRGHLLAPAEIYPDDADADLKVRVHCYRKIVKQKESELSAFVSDWTRNSAGLRPSLWRLGAKLHEKNHGGVNSRTSEASRPKLSGRRLPTLSY